MIEFLQCAKNTLASNEFVNLTIVLGNESCDLDSAVCSMVYATFLNWQHCQLKCKLCTRKYRDEVNYKDDIFVPVLNVSREDFTLKTEVTFCLANCGIDESMLVFRNDYDLKQLLLSHKTSVILVDHHVLAKEDAFLNDFVIDIIDHRPYDRLAWTYKEDTRSTIEVVGSCATLVCGRIKELASHTGGVTDFFKNHPQCADLLHSTVVLDTINFSKEVNKTMPLDEEVVLFLEDILTLEDPKNVRENKLSKLVQARMNVTSLSAAQLLRKDVKIIGPILTPTLPIPVKEFFRRPDVEVAMREALSKTKCSMLVVLGMELNGEKVTRDLAVYTFDTHIGESEKLATLLESWSQPSLQLVSSDANIGNCRYYQQNNLSASRKQVVPIINEYLKNTKIND